MDKVRLHDKTFRTFITNEELNAAIDRLSDKMNEDFKDCEDVPVLLCVLNGSIMFTAELMKRLTFNLEIVSIKLSSYEGTSSTGKVREAMGLTSDITGRRVIIVEDIVDTGNTIMELKDIVMRHGASDAKVCTMLLKPEVYKKDAVLDYVAMEIPDKFIVGFGLDYNQLGRNNKDIFVLDTDE